MKIILLTYINRSGSTFLSNELSKYKEVAVCPESDILTNLLLIKPWENIEKQKVQIASDLDKNEQLKYWKLDLECFDFPASLKTRFDVFLHILTCYQKQHQPSSELILYKNERLFQVLPEIMNKTNNKIYILLLLRDIRAIYHSQSTTLLPASKKFFSGNPVVTSMYWNSYVRSINKLKCFTCYKVFYEKLIADFGNEFNRIINFLELQPNNEMTNSGKVINFLPDSHQKIHANILKPPIAERISAWEKNLSQKEKQLIELTSKKYLINLNYNIFTNNNTDILNRIIFIYYIIHFRLVNLFRKVVYHIIPAKND